MGSRDSARKAAKTEKLLVDGREARWLYRVVRDTPHSVSLMAHIAEDELRRLGVGKGEGWGGVDINRVDKEGGRVDARSMRDSDVYDLLRPRMRQLDRYLASGLTSRQLAKIMVAQGLEPAPSLVTRRR